MFSLTIFLSIVGVFLTSKTNLAMPLCNGFYQAVPCYYRAEPSPLGQRLMYVQYMAPSHQGRVRAANDGLSTFVAADAIGANAGAGAGAAFVNEPQYSIDDKSTETERVKGAVSIAESYPAAESDEDFQRQQPEVNSYPAVVSPPASEAPSYIESNTIVNSNEVETDRKGKGPTNFYDSSELTTTSHPGYVDTSGEQHLDSTQVPQYAITAQAVSSPPATQSPVVVVSSPQPVVALGPAYIPPRKKIRVELETPSLESGEEQNEQVEQHSYEEEQQLPVNPKIASRRPPPPQQRPPANRPQLPPGSYFATHFGSTSGGAIAIANSFSTGEGGSATSHATAYGSPANGRTLSRKRA